MSVPDWGEDYGDQHAERGIHPAITASMQAHDFDFGWRLPGSEPAPPKVPFDKLLTALDMLWLRGKYIGWRD